MTFMTELLKQHDVNERDSYGMTPLMWATAHDQTDMVEFLLCLSPPASVVDDNINTFPRSPPSPQGPAADITLKAEMNENVLHIAASYGSETIMKMLLDKLKSDARNGLLSSSSSASCVTDVINARTYDGDTPLMHAAFHNHRGCVRTLLVHGADMMIRNGKGQTAMEIAAMMKFPEIQAAFNEYILSLLEPAMS